MAKSSRCNCELIIGPSVRSMRDWFLACCPTQPRPAHWDKHERPLQSVKHTESLHASTATFHIPLETQKTSWLALRLRCNDGNYRHGETFGSTAYLHVDWADEGNSCQTLGFQRQNPLKM